MPRFLMISLVLCGLSALTSGCSNGPTEGDAGAEANPAAPALSPTVLRPSEVKERRAPPGGAWVRFLARGNEAFLAQLIMEPGAAVPNHRDPTEEYIHVLEGSGVITIDGKEHGIGPGTTVFMPAGAEVSFVNGPERMKAIQVFAGPEPAAKYDAWTPTN